MHTILSGAGALGLVAGARGLSLAGSVAPEAWFADSGCCSD